MKTNIFRPSYPTLLLTATATLAMVQTAVNAPAAEAPPSGEHDVQFNRDIRPILADKCYACHGPDKNTREADLRLDTQEGALAERDGQAAVVPGDAAKSELVRRINSTDPEEAMPPKKHPKQLTAGERKLLERWIQQGAKWEGHWAYLPPVRSTPPAANNATWGHQPIDRFILARMTADGLQPAVEADRRTLARRLSFDLLGLPPKSEDVEAFVADRDPRAYENLVDRLLASPHYGERMAIYWLDLVRFADTIGYHSDTPRDIAPYRDYVIHSFNENLPFDQFTIEQLAGDLLPEATLNQKVASGYNRLLQTTEEGGAQAKEYESIYFADRVRNFSTVWLASTIGCAQCHDHKFDPFTTKDFYSLAAFFADVKEAAIGRREPGMPVPSEAQAVELARLDGRIAELKKELNDGTPAVAVAQTEWEKAFDQSTFAVWQSLKVVSAKAAADVTLETQSDGSLLAKDVNPDKVAYDVVLETSLKRLTALRLELLPDDSLPGHGPGRGAGGNLTLTEVALAVLDTPVDKPRSVPLAAPQASFAPAAAAGAPPVWQAAVAAEEKGKLKLTLTPAQIGRETQVILALKSPIDTTSETQLTVTLKQEAGKQMTLGRFRISATDSASPVPTVGLAPDDIAALIATPEAQRTAAAKQALAAHYRRISPLLAPVRKELAETEKRKESETAAIPRSLVSIAGPPREMRVKPRGNWMDDSGDLVVPAVPVSLGKFNFAAERGTRLDLARWLVSSENPLTARVMVNRIWKLCFGQGLARSLEDVGSQGDWPTHPELLDWLAVDFREHGWDVKRLVKQIVTSAAYRQSSLGSRTARDRDPYNRLLARQGRFRLDAEMLRDGALAAGGLLIDQVGGASAKPYQPEGYWTFLNFPKRDYPQDHGSNLYRRSLYTHWQRSFLHPMLLTFDAPSREECVADRPRSNTPQQALVLLNDPIFVETYRVFGEKIVRLGGSDTASRARWAFVRVLARPPQTGELETIVKLYEGQFSKYQQDPAAAAKLISVGEWPVAKDLDAAQVAAWTAVARTLLNLHEAVTRL